MVRHAGEPGATRPALAPPPEGKRSRDVGVWLSLRVVSSIEGPGVASEASRPRCFLCGRPTFDPDRRGRPWIRGVAGGAQALVCPRCQEERANWAEALDRCERCEGTRLSAMLGQVVCRACGHLNVVEVELE